MPRIDLDILNQKQTPAFYASSLATRPAASFVGRIFIDSDNPSTGLYRDTGTAWVQIADPGAGTTGTLQQVTTNGNSTTTGITITTNGLGIGTTIPGSNRLDIHNSSGINATFNGTGTSNAALQLQLAGVGKWNLSNFYNAAANDFIITDVLNSLNRLTIKNTGQTFIGTDVTSSGAFVVNNATSDNHIVCIGANAPSIRLRNTGTAPTLNVGFGISTATNNFIQGSASGDYCIFNSSTTASPILFGIYDAGAGNTPEAGRISAARNFLFGGTSDNGSKLQIIGTQTILKTNTSIIADASLDASITYTPTTTINDINTYNFISRYTLDLTNGVYNTSTTTNASSIFGFAIIKGNNGTISTQPIKNITSALSVVTSAIKLADYRAFNVNTLDSSISGCTITSAYGLYISQLKGSTNFTITNGYGIYQAGTNDNNYFAGKLGIVTTLPTGNFGIGDQSKLVETAGITLGGGYGVIEFIGSTFGAGYGIKLWQSSDRTFSIAGRAGSTNFTNYFTVYDTGKINISTISTYGSNALALAGGLVAGDIYKGATGILSIVY